MHPCPKPHSQLTQVLRMTPGLFRAQAGPFDEKATKLISWADAVDSLLAAVQRRDFVRPEALRQLHAQGRTLRVTGRAWEALCAAAAAAAAAADALRVSLMHCGGDGDVAAATERLAAAAVMSAEVEELYKTRLLPIVKGKPRARLPFVKKKPANDAIMDNLQWS
eukprot:4689630-Pleurochrysis_carterae.AAC.2